MRVCDLSARRVIGSAMHSRKSPFWGLGVRWPGLACPPSRRAGVGTLCTCPGTRQLGSSLNRRGLLWMRDVRHRTVLWLRVLFADRLLRVPGRVGERVVDLDRALVHAFQLQRVLRRQRVWLLSRRRGKNACDPEARNSRGQGKWSKKKRQKRSCKSVTVKGEVWGGLIPGLPYTAVDYVIIMKNVRHKEEFQKEAKSGKVPKRAVKCSRRAS